MSNMIACYFKFVVDTVLVFFNPFEVSFNSSYALGVNKIFVSFSSFWVSSFIILCVIDYEVVIPVTWNYMSRILL